MKLFYQTAVALFIAVIITAQPANATFFKDISEVDPQLWAVRFLEKESIIQGYGDGYFRPRKIITRAEAVKMVVVSNFGAIDTQTFANCFFPDVSPPDWHYSYICKANENNIVSGYPRDGFFGPSDALKLAEAVKIIAFPYYDYIPKKEGGKWYEPFFNAALKLRIIPPESSPAQLLTRAEFSEILAKKIIKDAQINAFLIGQEFMVKKMMSENGGVYQTETNHEITSESIGLALNVAALMGNKDLFEKIYTFMKKYMLKNHPLPVWKLKKNLAPYSLSSAVVDDLQIIKALLRAFELSGKIEYKETALKLAQALKNYGTRDSVLVSAVSWDANGIYTGSDLILAYPDFDVIDDLMMIDPEWEEIFENTFNIISEGERENGFYETKYIFENKTYKTEEPVNTIFLALNALNMYWNSRTLEFFKNEYSTRGKIVNAYTLDGKPASQDEDLAVYGLIGRLALGGVSDFKFAEKITQKIISLQIRDKSSPKYGAFAWNEADSVYAYSHLNVLYFLAEILKEDIGKRP